MTKESIAAMVVVFVLSMPAVAQDPCGKYYGRGYCTDWVQRRLGVKQGGNAEDWKCNIAMIDVRPGDVAVFRPKNHVAVVEEVIRSERGTPKWVVLSEWNWGRLDRSDPEKTACWVTNKFGANTTPQRKVLTGSATCYWRP